MIAAIALLLLAMCTIIALSAAPRRIIVSAPAALLAAILLVEEAGVAPRIAIMIALVVAFLLAVVNTSATPRGASAPPAGVLAWERLTGAAGILTRGRITTLKRRYDTLLSRDGAIDPFSTFGELQIKLERRVPELIDNYLDEAASAPTLRRHVLMTELLGEIEGLVVRAEAVDPHALARIDRRRALKNHLKGDDQSS
ncbi:hypothetical protein [uncultured Sphingomonas sp.]|uniref:hypothetical protein n=1 Tax=uncultured Sphingomonas sp. TaxID=158754 RepID=UPI0025F47F8C|nr:hypothetical protein [uncultured Sphingomonas sp.]